MNIAISQDILKQLYHGDICPVETIPSGNPDYINASNKLVDIISALEAALPKNKRYLLEQLEEWQSTQNMIELEATFKTGFQLGAQIMLAVQERNINHLSITITENSEKPLQTDSQEDF